MLGLTTRRGRGHINVDYYIHDHQHIPYTSRVLLWSSSNHLVILVRLTTFQEVRSFVFCHDRQNAKDIIKFINEAQRQDHPFHASCTLSYVFFPLALSLSSSSPTAFTQEPLSLTPLILLSKNSAIFFSFRPSP